VKFADVFTTRLRAVYNNSSSGGGGGGVHPSSIFDDILSLPCVMEVDILNTVMRLKPTESVGLGDIPSFVIILAPALQHIFSVSLPL
jgi:hypothetical protein